MSVTAKTIIIRPAIHNRGLLTYAKFYNLRQVLSIGNFFNLQTTDTHGLPWCNSENYCKRLYFMTMYNRFSK